MSIQAHSLVLDSFLVAPIAFDELYFTGAFVPMQNPATATSAPIKKQSKAEESIIYTQRHACTIFLINNTCFSHLEQIAHRLEACLLIDDSLENALNSATHSPPLPVILFGHYPWNSHLSVEDTPQSPSAHKERVLRGIETCSSEDLAEKMRSEEELKGRLHLPENVHRVRDWDEVVDFIRILAERP